MARLILPKIRPQSQFDCRNYTITSNSCIQNMDGNRAWVFRLLLKEQWSRDFFTITWYVTANNHQIDDVTIVGCVQVQ